MDAVLGGSGTFQPMPVLEEADDLDGGAGYPVITGDYTAAPAWQVAGRSSRGPPWKT